MISSKWCKLVPIIFLKEGTYTFSLDSKGFVNSVNFLKSSGGLYPIQPLDFKSLFPVKNKCAFTPVIKSFTIDKSESIIAEDN